MVETSSPIEIFCSYAHEDESWLRKLETHLSLLKRQGLISPWHDRLIVPGADWAKTIDAHLETASVILLLVSADFLASDYCYGIEMKRALERHEAGEARVLPILVRPVEGWQQAPFAHLQALPTDARPLASWRNKDTALADVAAGIRRVIVEELPHLSASAPRAALPAIWNIPYPHNPFFLGRDDELALLRHHLQTGQATALSQAQAISGLGGIGKTQLALEYAYRYYQDYQAVLWARAESTETMISSYVALATLLRLPEREEKEQEVTVQAVKIWLQTHRGWLLILDNADDLSLLLAFLPPSLGGHLLLTTRATATGRLAHRIEIEILTPKQGALFFLRRSGLLPPDATLEDASPPEQSLALQLSTELGGLPLALDQAGAYVEETGTNLVEYWQLYQQYRADLLQQRGGLVSDHSSSVATTWLVSFQRVEERNPAAADLLRLLAWLPPDGTAEEILPAGASFLGPVLAPVAENGLLRNQAIEALRAYSLIRRDPKEHMLSMHRLVQAVLRDRQGEAERRLWIERMIQTINAAFPAGDEYENWPQCERLLLHALLAAQWSETYQISRTEMGRLLHETATYLRWRARYAEAEPLCQHALRIWEQQLGPEHPLVAYPLNGLADLYTSQGKYVEAEPLYQRALRIREQQLGPEHSETAYTIGHLARFWEAQDNNEEASVLFARALRIYEQALGAHHSKTTETRERLIALLHAMGQHEEAARLEATQPES
jgi:tetratricopeptide (TPR) repeat protein